MSQGTWEALRWIDVSYTCTLRRVTLIPERRHITSQSLVYSTDSAWRRRASIGWNTALAATLRRNPLLRLELHPRDVEHDAIRRSWQGLLEKHLADREALTLAQMADRYRAETDWDSLGSGMDTQLDDHEEELRRDHGDAGANEHVARVVQPEHHA
jgi:predicted deacetylase